VASNGGSTIVLIGGEATLDSGATIESRQPLAGDEWDVVLRQALGTSEAWWSLAKDFVDVVLAQHSRTDAWALAWVDKTLKRPRADGTFTRVRLKPFLDQAANLIDAASDGSPRFRSDAASSRYRLVPWLLRFDDMQGGPPPAVIVGGFHTTYDDGTDIVGDRPLDYFVSRWPDAVIVLPHTPIVEAKARRILKRRPGPAATHITASADQTHPAESRRYAASLERIEDLQRADSYVLSHDFHITFWADEGEVRDAADLDAAMTFVKSRYDLNLGLWDLAREPALRETLLEREAIALPSAAPTVVPGELAAKATEKATERREAEAAELDGRRRHHQAIWPTLSREGWHIPPWQREGVDYRLAAGPLVPSPFAENYDEPALFLSLGIQKRQAVLALVETSLTGRTKEFLEAHRDLIARITGAPPDEAKQVVWRIPGKGWAGSAQGWPQHLQTIASLVAKLAPLLEPLGEIAAEERIDQLKSTPVEVTFTISPSGTATAEKKSMWDRLRGRNRR
jgi:hypothetical protein